jgi:hypothetical protein
MNHFTDLSGWNAIRSQREWLFKAEQPPGDHPFGAYFTTLESGEPNLANKLRIPREKLAYVFSFRDRAPSDLSPLNGGRGKFIFFSPQDYAVEEVRQLANRGTGL